MINRLFKSTKRVDLIENGKVTHYFKITFLNNDTKVFDNYGKEVPKSKINNNNGGNNYDQNNKG
tara:strand:- start:8357 stop:8548 length:192 start_codon:yes stop_codon:yes gene_type:complete